MLGIVFFLCGTYQTTSEHITVLNSWYQTDMSLYFNRYLLFDRKSVGRNDSHIFCATPCYFSLPGWRHWVTWQPRAPAQKATRTEMQIVCTHCYPSTSATVSLTTRLVAMKNALFWAIKISELVNELSVIMVITWFTWPLMTSWVIENGTIITRARDEKRRIGNMVMSAGMSTCKSVNIYFIQKSFLLDSVNRHKWVTAQTWTEDIKIQTVRWFCNIHEYFAVHGVV